MWSELNVTIPFCDNQIIEKDFCLGKKFNVIIQYILHNIFYQSDGRINKLEICPVGACNARQGGLSKNNTLGTTCIKIRIECLIVSEE